MVSSMVCCSLNRVVALIGLTALCCISSNAGAVASAGPGHNNNNRLRHLDNVDFIDLLDSPLDEDLLSTGAPFNAFARKLQEDTDGPTPSPTVADGGGASFSMSPTSDFESGGKEIPETEPTTPSPSSFEISEVITPAPSVNSFEISAAPTAAPSSGKVSEAPTPAPTVPATEISGASTVATVSSVVISMAAFAVAVVATMVI